MRPGPTTAWAAAGVVVGIAACSVILAAGWLDDQIEDEPPPEHVAGMFVTAWGRSRTSTFVVESEFLRERVGTAPFEAETYLAQRPPERLQVQFGTATGRVDGRIVSCASEDDEYRCVRGDPHRSFEEGVERELQVLRSYLVGDPPLYSVERTDDGCFELTQERPLAAPPYGSRARFCFDGATGAPTFTRIERREATDTTRATEIRPEVTDEDLQPPA